MAGLERSVSHCCAGTDLALPLPAQGVGAQCSHCRGGSSSTSPAGSMALPLPQPLLGASLSPLCLAFSSSSSLPRTWQSAPGASCCWSLPVGACPAPQHAPQHAESSCFLGKKRQQSPSGSTSGQPCTATTATSAYELQEKDLGRLHHAAACGDLDWLRRWHWWLKTDSIDR